MNHFEGVIFDLDGTLVDSLEDIADAANRTLSRLGYVTFSYDEYRYFVGKGLKQLIYNVLCEQTSIDRSSLTIDSPIVQQVLDLMMEEYRKTLIDKTRLYPGVSNLLDQLTQRGFRLAILSNKANELVQEIVASLLNRWSFDVVLGTSARFPRKPDPASALYIAEEMKTLPKHILYLGDTDIDMQTARNAGMAAIGVTWGFRTREELIDNGALITIDRPMELLTNFID